jgi:hypothetical protein
MAQTRFVKLKEMEKSPSSALQVDEQREVYDAFGDIGTIFRALEWKAPIFSAECDRNLQTQRIAPSNSASTHPVWLY